MFESERRSELCILDHTGDTKVSWSSVIPDEVSEAKATFDRMRSRGYLGFKPGVDGGRGEVIKAFDATAERIVMTPPAVGG